jgi:hypothetical protein
LRGKKEEKLSKRLDVDGPECMGCKKKVQARESGTTHLLDVIFFLRKNYGIIDP